MTMLLNSTTIISILVLFLASMAASICDPFQETILQCLSTHSSSPVSEITFFPNSSSFSPILNSYIRNLRFSSPTTPKPLFIITPTHISHIQASILCCKIHSLQIRIRSGGHDYDGLSYVSNSPFIIIDMFNLRSVSVDSKDGFAWVDSGATLGEFYFNIAEKSNILGFPAGVCPTVGVGGHVSGAGYGNLMRKFGVSVDYVMDALIVDVNGRVLDRELMGEDLFWAIRGGGGASFGVIVSWKLKLVPLPEIVTVFRIEKTLEDGLVDILYKWQQVADKIDDNLFIRVVILPVNRKNQKTVKAKFVSLFLGNAKDLFLLMTKSFPELGLKSEDCLEMSWIDSVLFWSNYPVGTSPTVLLQRQSNSEKFLKKKSDYVQEPISKEGLEGLMTKMMELKRPALTFNPYGGKMSQIPEAETPFPHRAGNMYKIQYSVTWKEEGNEADDKNLDLIRKLYEYMTPYVSKSPRGAYLNYRDVDLGINENVNASSWGSKYFKGNFERLVKVKTMVDPHNFFRYEQSIPSVAAFNIQESDSNDRVESL